MSFSASDLASYLKQTDFNVTVRGLARGLNEGEETFEFSPLQVAGQEWIRIDLDGLEGFMPLGITEHRDRVHPLLELNFRSSNLPQALSRFVHRGEEEGPVALAWTDDGLDFADIGNERGQEGVGRDSVNVDAIDEALGALQKQDVEALLSSILGIVSDVLSGDINLASLEHACESPARGSEAMRLLRQFRAAPDMQNARRLQRFVAAGSANKKCMRAIVQHDGNKAYGSLAVLLALLLA